MQHQQLDFKELDDTDEFSDSELQQILASELENLKHTLRTHHLCDLRKNQRSSPDGQRTGTVLL
jgi:hypothetical protein